VKAEPVVEPAPEKPKRGRKKMEVASDAIEEPVAPPTTPEKPKRQRKKKEEVVEA
jgi:hypothetical protein